MKVIGLTGGIGSGKSTVSQFLAELGAIIIDADKVGHEAFQPDTEPWRKVVTAFGPEIVKPNGEIDRNKLGKMAFGNAELLSRLNQIMHPRIYDMIRSQIEDYRRWGVAVVIVEVPLLIEADWTPLVDEVWVTVAPETTVLGRLQERSGLSKQDTLARIRSQLPIEERVRHADVVIDTDCTLNEVQARVKQLWEGLRLG
ncbi:dephospho-CoA kinase [Chloroflexota bacterium]